jgi:hypothetical protein
VNGAQLIVNPDVTGKVRYEVACDIRYLDGALKGLTIPSGYRCRYPDLTSAHRCVSWVIKIRKSGDFVRAVGTGNRYEFVGEVSMIGMFPNIPD